MSQFEENCHEVEEHEKHDLDVVDNIAESLCNIVQMSPNPVFQQKALQTFRVTSVTALHEELTIKINKVLENSKKKNKRTKQTTTSSNSEVVAKPCEDFSPVKKKTCTSASSIAEEREFCGNEESVVDAYDSVRRKDKCNDFSDDEIN